jgi:hypothetical protein
MDVMLGAVKTALAITANAEGEGVGMAMGKPKRDRNKADERQTLLPDRE